MAKRRTKIKYKNSTYCVDDKGVTIWWDGSSKSESFIEHYYLYDLTDDLVTEIKRTKIIPQATQAQIEDYLEKMFNLVAEGKRLQEDWSNKLKNHTDPKLQKGEHIVFDLSYCTVLYEVSDIKKYQGDGDLFYVLKGKRILKDDGTNPYKTEAREYHPFCYVIDEDEKTQPKVKKVSNEELTSLLSQGEPVR